MSCIYLPNPHFLCSFIQFTCMHITDTINPNTWIFFTIAFVLNSIHIEICFALDTYIEVHQNSFLLSSMILYVCCFSVWSIKGERGVNGIHELWCLHFTVFHPSVHSFHSIQQFVSTWTFFFCINWSKLLSIQNTRTHI